MKSLGGPSWAYATLLLAGLGCSQAFTAGTSTTSTTGAAGSTTTSTSGTTTTGTGGAPACTTGACPANEYCNTQSGSCESCIDSTRFSFGTPVVIPVALPMAGASALYPRVDPSTYDLYLVQQGQGAAHLNQIASAAYQMGKPIPWSTATLVPQLIGTHQDSGPFPLTDPSQLAGLVDDSISKLGKPVLLFDSDRLGGKHVFAIGLQQLSPTQVMLPGNATLESNITIATSAAPPRFFWISNPGDAGAEELVTTTAAANTATPVSITLDTSCVTPLPDTPWVTPGGDRLLFTSADLGPSPGCTPNAAVTHLYEVVLDTSGQPTGKAQRIFPNATTTDTTPSLTPDRCELLFSRVDAGGVEVYAAPRN